MRLRSQAVPGDLICVTGTLGKSEAGLRLLLNGQERRLPGRASGAAAAASNGRASAIARHAHAMIDVSDGLGSEVRHICEESGTGARIDWEKIPLSRDTMEAARKISGDPHEYALYGGEDFELVFTIPKVNIPALHKEFSDFTIVGEILPKEHGIFILKDGQEEEMKKGYDHFAA